MHSDPRRKTVAVLQNVQGDGTPKSDIIIQGKLPGMGPEVEGENFVAHFVVDPGLDNVTGEDVPLQKKVVVRFQGIEGFPKRAGSLGNAGGFLGRKVIDVFVEGIAGVDFVADSVDYGHQDSREGQVGVARGIGTAEFEAFGFFRG